MPRLRSLIFSLTDVYTLDIPNTLRTFYVKVAWCVYVIALMFFLTY